MARLRVIILDQPSGDSQAYRAAFWADVPAARQSYYASPSLNSSWNGALPADIDALRNGSVTEQVQTIRFAPGATILQIETYLQAIWTNFQSYVTAANPGIHYGSTWDGTAWIIVNAP